MKKSGIAATTAFMILTYVIYTEDIDKVIKVPGRPDNFTEGVWIKKYPKNYACFKFETPDGIRIVCDPYEMDETVSADIVTESHEDSDHGDLSMITGFYNLFRNPGEYRELGIKVTGIGGWHDKSGPRNETNTIFIFDIDGIKIAHFGSLGQFPDKDLWSKLEIFNGIDILLIQVFSDSHVYIKLTVGECCQIIDRLKPKIVIPEHGTPSISKDIAAHYGAKVNHIGKNGFVVTKYMLESIKGRRIFDLDNGMIFLDDGTMVSN